MKKAQDREKTRLRLPVFLRRSAADAQSFPAAFLVPYRR